jgi:hypothetical protein
MDDSHVPVDINAGSVEKCCGRLSEKNGGSQIGAQEVQHDPALQAVEPSLFLVKLFGSIFCI